MAHLDVLLPYVRAGTAEGDKAFLNRVFIPPTQLQQLLGIEAGGMRLLIGNKGTGKSATVEWINLVAARRGLPCLLLRPDDLHTDELPSGNDIGSLKKHFYETLASSIAIQIGSKLKGLVRGDAIPLLAAAQDAGAKPRDAVQTSLALLSAVAAPVTKINGPQLAKELTGTTNAPALTRAIQNHLLTTGSVFMLMIDDTDQVASPGTPSHLNRIWALLLAIRRLAGECPAVRAIVTLRSEIWNRLVSESEGQRDQADHLRGLVVSIRGTDSLIENIVRRRLERAASDVGLKQDPYTVFFQGSQVTLPSSIVTRSWDQFIAKSSRERPRDAIQLIKNMVDRAIANQTDVIGAKEAEQAMDVYSKERVDDLYNEFAPDCGTIRQVLGSFTELDFESNFEKLRAHLRTIPSRFTLIVRGITLKPQDDADAITLLSLLHESGFINPRVLDSSKPLGYNHVLFQDDPNFVKYANWNKMQAASWEIHPAFRSFLLARKANH